VGLDLHSFNFNIFPGAKSNNIMSPKDKPSCSTKSSTRDINYAIYVCQALLSELSKVHLDSTGQMHHRSYISDEIVASAGVDA
jgi:hypothetical protein